MSEFYIYGPINIPVKKMSQGRMIEPDLSEFWDEEEDVADCIGCYVFGMRSRNISPIYVGKATKSFRQECFSHHKLSSHYNVALLEYLRGSPVMFFIVQDGRKNVSEIEELEKFLIQIAIARNPDLSNIKGTKQANWSIAGVIRNSMGRPSNDSISFKNMMNL